MLRCFAQFLNNLFRFKIDIELSQLGFLSSMASEFKNLFIQQSNSKHNGRYDFREKRMAFFIRHSLTSQISFTTDTGSKQQTQRDNKNDNVYLRHKNTF